MKRKSLTELFLFFAAVSLLTAGCASDTAKIRNAPQFPHPAPRADISRQPGSIWPGEGAASNIFADKKARYVNDIVTVVVSEITQGTTKADTNTSRKSSTTAGITGLLGIDKSIKAANAKLSGGIEVGGSASNSLKGEGDTSRKSSFTTRVTARVTKVFDNGNLFIEGWRKLRMNGESQYVVLSGIIRPEDITSDNLISSQYIADARIDYVGDGVINEKMRPGWLTRIVDYVWPF
jgi:flagellar L-ring protein FlgH